MIIWSTRSGWAEPPRLQLLREFLSEDGSIWVSIDDNEGHYLKVVMDEVFGRRNCLVPRIFFDTSKQLNRFQNIVVLGGIIARSEGQFFLQLYAG